MESRSILIGINGLLFLNIGGDNKTKARCRVPPLNTQYLEKFGESEEQCVLTLGRGNLILSLLCYPAVCRIQLKANLIYCFIPLLILLEM